MVHKANQLRVAQERPERITAQGLLGAGCLMWHGQKRQAPSSTGSAGEGSAGEGSAWEGSAGEGKYWERQYRERQNMQGEYRRTALTIEAAPYWAHAPGSACLMLSLGLQALAVGWLRMRLHWTEAQPMPPTLHRITECISQMSYTEPAWPHTRGPVCPTHLRNAAS